MPKLQLPQQLEQYRAELEKTALPYVQITAERGEAPLFASKFGGYPYLPKTAGHPKDSEGNFMSLFAQINFAEVPHVDPFPKKGMLQFFLSPVSEEYGLDFDNPTSQKDFRIVYHPEVIEDEAQLVTDFSYIPDLGDEYGPIVEEGRMFFERAIAPMQAEDFRFENEVDIDLSEPSGHEEYEDLYELYYEELNASGHKIGGYPYFTQSDPREEGEPSGDYKILLFQADTDDEIELMFGDSGVANFFIKEEDLRRLDFSNVYYNWDCC